MAAISGNNLAFVEFDFSGKEDNVYKIAFDYGAWSAAAVTNIKALADPLFGLQVYNEVEEKWETLTSEDGKETLTDDLTFDFQEVTYNITGGTKFRLVVFLENATSTTNTYYAMAVDNFKVWME